MNILHLLRTHYPQLLYTLNKHKKRCLSYSHMLVFNDSMYCNCKFINWKFSWLKGCHYDCKIGKNDQLSRSEEILGRMKNQPQGSGCQHFFFFSHWSGQNDHLAKVHIDLEKLLFTNKPKTCPLKAWHIFMFVMVVTIIPQYCFYNHILLIFQSY